MSPEFHLPSQTIIPLRSRRRRAGFPSVAERRIVAARPVTSPSPGAEPVMLGGFVAAVHHSGHVAAPIDEDRLFERAAHHLEQVRAETRAFLADTTVVPLHLVTPTETVADTPDTPVPANIVRPRTLGLAFGMGQGQIVKARAGRAIDHLAAEARERAEELEATLHGPDKELSELAGTHLRALTGQLIGSLYNAPTDEPKTRSHQIVHELNDRMWTWRAATVVLPKKWWGWAPLVSGLLKPAAFLAVLWFLSTGHPLLALMTFVVGRIVSLALPSAYGNEPLNGPESRFSWRASVYGHFADAFGVLAVAAYLVGQQRTFWAAMLSLSAVAMLSGTIIRLAALHSADFVERLHLERVARDGAMLTALWLEVLFAHTGQVAEFPGTGIPVAVVAGIGPVVYAGLEAWRVVRRVRRNQMRRSGLSPEERLADLYLEFHPAIDEPRFQARCSS